MIDSRALIVVIGLVGGMSAGCHARVYGHARVRYVEPEPVVFVDSPDLVLVGDGVYVVQDYDYPVYYIDGAYYSYRGGVWYHTSHWSDPWVTVHVGVVPNIVVHRDHHAYVHYRASAGAHVIRDSRPRRHSAHATASVDGHTSAKASSRGDRADRGDHDAKPTSGKHDFDRNSKVDADDRQARVENDAPKKSRRRSDDDDNERSSKSTSRNKDRSDRSDGPDTRAASSGSSQPKPAQKPTRKSSGGKKRSRR